MRFCFAISISAFAESNTFPGSTAARPMTGDITAACTIWPRSDGTASFKPATEAATTSLSATDGVG
ncbi:hypothetical protein D3C72_2246210 [compost metagenome]